MRNYPWKFINAFHLAKQVSDSNQGTYLMDSISCIPHLLAPLTKCIRLCANNNPPSLTLLYRIISTGKYSEEWKLAGHVQRQRPLEWATMYRHTSLLLRETDTHIAQWDVRFSTPLYCAHFSARSGVWWTNLCWCAHNAYQGITR